jgi:hypothetical protein
MDGVAATLSCASCSCCTRLRGLDVGRIVNMIVRVVAYLPRLRELGANVGNVSAARCLVEQKKQLGRLG